MALIGSQSVIFRSPGTKLSGGLSTCRANWESTSQMRSAWIGDTDGRFLAKTSIPDGYRPACAWVMAISDGGLASRRQIFGTGGVTAGNLAGGLNGVAPLTGAGDITNAALGLILSAVAAISGSGTISSAAIVGKLEAAATLAGTGDLTAALGALASAVAALTGSGTITATATASGSMSADITVSGELLTTANVAAAVWDALAASFDNPGTMGELLNSAGAGGDPWSTTDGQNVILRLYELYKIHGLKSGSPLTVTPTTRVADDVSQTITGDGTTTTTVTRA